MNAAESVILSQIKNIIREQEPSAKIILYGSRSRGSAKNNSDWDILILINKDKISAELEQKITYPLYDLEFDTGEVISPTLYTEKEWTTKYQHTSFYVNVMKEGRLI